MKFSEDPPRPRIKLPLNSHDRVIEFIGIAFLLFLFVLPLRYYSDIPGMIPTHFNAAGSPDGFGSKTSLWFLPLTGLVLWLIMTIVNRFPDKFNFPVKITPENAEVQYRIGTRVIRILKSVILMMFSFISYRTIQTAMGNEAGLGKVFLPVFLLLTFGIIIIYLVQANKNRNQS
ncbi:MAG: DUF1648 domain-containing protein [Bacteroidales bacterium]|jgi:uncharacterized membrane protein